MPIISISLPSDGTSADVADYNDPLIAILAVVNGLLDDDNIASLSGTKILPGTLSISSLTADALKNWTTGVLPAPNTVTYNGQRSYDLVFNSTDLTDEVSEGMRVRATRSTPAPTQVTSLSGTKYWSKATPNKFSWTDDFVIDVSVKPSSHVLGTIVSCYNGTSGWALRMGGDGVVALVAYNAGAANYSQVNSYGLLPLNKTTRITLQLDMSAFTVSATTSYVMFNGENVSASVSRGGTFPTALIQAGNLNVGAENGGTNPFQGEISQLAIFNTKVTQATARSYHSQGYSGAESTLASAYSFNGVATDLNTTTPNDLSAQNSAGYATGGGFGNNGVSTTLEYGIITKKAFSTNTTLTVQVPDGCAIPTSGTVSAFAYSSDDNPYGFVRDPARWNVESVYSIALTSGSIASTATTAPIVGGQIAYPIGPWEIGFSGFVSSLHGGVTFLTAIVALSTSTSSVTNGKLSGLSPFTSSSSTESGGSVLILDNVNITSPTTYYLVANPINNNTTVQMGRSAGLPQSRILGKFLYV